MGPPWARAAGPGTFPRPQGAVAAAVEIWVRRVLAAAFPGASLEEVEGARAAPAMPLVACHTLPQKSPLVTGAAREAFVPDTPADKA
jgi:hypothetical protein